MFINTFSNFMFLHLKLLLTCIFYTICYFITYLLLEDISSFKYLKMDKKLYVIKNIIKSISLCYLSIISYGLVYDIFMYDTIDMQNMRNWGCIFVANDLTALFLIPNLPKNTRNHHITTGILLNAVFLFDGNEMEFVKLIAIYTIFSYYAFLVNLYLGCRYLELEISDNNNSNNKLSIRFNRWIDYLRVIAFYNYAISLAINWSFHLYYCIFMITSLQISHIIYALFLIPIIQDDIILLSWLKYKKNRA